MSYSLKANLVLRLLKSLKYGELHLTMPDGKEFFFKGENPGPKGELRVFDLDFFSRLIKSSDIGVAECYRDHLIETPDLTNLLLLAIENQKVLEEFFKGNFFGMIAYKLRHKFRSNSKSGSKKNIHAHYDLGNQFYSLWLDSTMTYSSALFLDDKNSLEEAQKNKYQRIIDSLKLKSTDHILEIGSGWGGFATQAALQTGCKITCLTISQEQFKFTQQKIKNLKLEHLVQVKLCDYREEKGLYDHIVSIEMIEAVGEGFWDHYFSVVKNRLKPGGRAMIQAILIKDDLFESYRNSTDFIQQYIFPGGMLLAPQIFDQFSKKYNLKVSDFFKFGPDYARTLSTWRETFSHKIEDVKRNGFDDSFIKLWNFYYCYCEAGFRSRRIDVAQVILEN